MLVLQYIQTILILSTHRLQTQTCNSLFCENTQGLVDVGHIQHRRLLEILNKLAFSCLRSISVILWSLRTKTILIGFVLFISKITP